MGAPTLNDPEAYLSYRKSEGAPKFFFGLKERETFQSLFDQWDTEGSPLEEAEEILAGRFRFYSKTETETGFPPNWHRNHFMGEEVPADVHWSRLADFGFGDIKNIWELSRFGWAFTLVRAYWRTGDESFPEAFWTLFEDWLKRNQPNQGANWKCGQEISFRLMAWCFALHGFLDAASTTAARLQALLKAVAVSGERIVANIDYAISQKNNHGISEGMGLWTIGLLFPELKNARLWKEKGERVLECLAADLIYEDGAFSQHSMNYHRVMLDDFIWAIRLGELNGSPLAAGLRANVAAAADFLWRCQDDHSGSVPLYGSNDGALILPLSNCDYRDFRAVVTSGRLLSHGFMSLSPGPWDEAILWLRGPGSLHGERRVETRPKSVSSETGYLVLRDEDGFLFSRAGSYRHRPAEADSLHVDLWWRGLTIAGDAGTYSYNPRLGHLGNLKGTAVHNVVSVDGRDQMEKVGRFLWLPWIWGEWRRREGPDAFWFEGWQDGYQRLADPVEHRRALFSGGGGFWVVLDRLKSEKVHELALQWLLGDFPVKELDAPGAYCLDTPEGFFHLAMESTLTMSQAEISLVKGDALSSRGWRSSYYQQVEAVPSILLRQEAREATFITVFSPKPVQISVAENRFYVSSGDRRFSIGLAPVKSKAVVDGITSFSAIVENTK